MMRSTVNLTDGTGVVIRSLRRDDLPGSVAFFRSLPAEDRAYLRRDVTRKSVIEQRIREAELNKVRRLVALFDEKIVADGALELKDHDWQDHVGELRLIVAPRLQRKGLGMLMARELYFLAAREKLEEIVVKMMRPQIAAYRIFKRLGFREEATLRDYVKDLSGSRQDLVVMRCDLKSMWLELQEFLEESDWHRTR
jgi:L-amino acid N-acyltransferase YncA